MYVYPFCTSIFNFEGADGSTTFTDSGRYANTLTAVGNARIRTADFKVGSSSLYLDGTGDYVTGGTSLGPFFDASFPQGVITMESWVRIKVDPAGDAMLFGFWRTTGNSRWVQVAISSTRQVLIKTSTNGTASATSSSGVTLAADTWTHVRVIAYGSPGTRYISLYVDGVLVYTTAALTLNAINTNMRFQIGGDDVGGSIMSESYYDGVIVQQGYISAAPSLVAIDSSGFPLLTTRRVPPQRKFSPFSQLTANTSSFVRFLPTPPRLFNQLVTPIRAPNFGTPTGTIDGVVTILGIPTQRTVRAYRRDTGAFVSEATSDGVTGEYSILVFSGVEHNLVCLDDPAGTVQNDLIKRKTAA